MQRFTRLGPQLLTSSVLSLCLFLLSLSWCATARADDDDDEKSTPKPAAQKDLAEDEKAFEELDENEDGRLSGTEMSTVKEYDLDKDGRVSKAEFMAGRAKARLAKSKPDATPPAAPPTEPTAAPPQATPPATPPGAKPQAQPTPTPAQLNSILGAVGNLSVSQVAITSRYMNLLGTAFEKGLVPDKEVEQKMVETTRMLTSVSQSLAGAKEGMTQVDRDFVSAVQEIQQLLLTQAQQLVVYTKAKDEKHLAALKTAEANVEARFKKMFGGGGGGSGQSQPTGSGSEFENTVNAAAGEGNKFSEQAGAKFKEIFADEVLNAFPGNRDEFLKNSKVVAEILGKAAGKYRDAAALCEKESKKGGTDARYWSLKGRSFRRIAEAKEKFKEIALLVEDETIDSRNTFETRAKPLLDEALEVNAESQKLSKEAAELWDKLHPKK